MKKTTKTPINNTPEALPYSIWQRGLMLAMLRHSEEAAMLVAEIRRRDGEGNTIPDWLYRPVARAAVEALKNVVQPSTT